MCCLAAITPLWSRRLLGTVPRRICDYALMSTYVVYIVSRPPFRVPPKTNCAGWFFSFLFFIFPALAVGVCCVWCVGCWVLCTWRVFFVFPPPTSLYFESSSWCRVRCVSWLTAVCLVVNSSSLASSGHSERPPPSNATTKKKKKNP